jgi:Restriction endonuclease
MTPSWRKFEQLVARIEHLLAPKGAVVKSPDYIPDLVTGQKREVDASIRFQIGSVPILITIECRERAGIQDDTWIEQLATKREKIGAAKTIAVSATGFTKPATKSAQHYGIELRHIDDITDSEIAKQWVESIVIEAELFEYSLVSARVHFDTAEKIDGLELSLSIQVIEPGEVAECGHRGHCDRAWHPAESLESVDDRGEPPGLHLVCAGLFQTR